MSGANLKEIPINIQDGGYFSEMTITQTMWPFLPHTIDSRKCLKNIPGSENSNRTFLENRLYKGLQRKHLILEEKQFF